MGHGTMGVTRTTFARIYYSLVWPQKVHETTNVEQTDLRLRLRCLRPETSPYSSSAAPKFFPLTRLGGRPERVSFEVRV